MHNSFFTDSLDKDQIKKRILEISGGRVGFYSVGLYPASLAYNCAMQTGGDRLLLAPRPGRDLLGAFTKDALHGMDKAHVDTIKEMSFHKEGDKEVVNTLSDLILRCELIVLSSNSNHIQSDLKEACRLRIELDRENVLLACLAGSFCHDDLKDESFVLCEKEPNLAFFSGFHRHGSLRNPLDSFTANFCHPNALIALLGAHLLDKISPNIQVSAGVHNIEGQYIKAVKNISSIFAGFGYTFHKDNPGVLPTLLTLLLNQCLDQAASVSMKRSDRIRLYEQQPFSLTELGYGVQKIEAALVRDGEMRMVRDHTFSQLTAMVADVRGSMMKPVSGEPTRNFSAGIVLAENMKSFQRCPESEQEFLSWCINGGLSKGSLEGLKSLRCWPQIVKKYSIPLNDSSMINLLFLVIYGTDLQKSCVFNVLTKSRELSSYCQESVQSIHNRSYIEALDNLARPDSIDMLTKAVLFDVISCEFNDNDSLKDDANDSIGSTSPDYIYAMKLVDNSFSNQ